MRDDIKQFIERNIDEIENNQFFDLFEIAAVALPFYEDCGILSRILEDAELQPIIACKCIPAAYFAGREDIERYVTPATVKEIRARAFQNCKNLKELVLYKDVDIVQSFVCWNCELDYLEIQNPLIEVSVRAFNQCKIKHIKFHGTIDQFYNSGFYGNWLAGTNVDCIDGSEIL